MKIWIFPAVCIGLVLSLGASAHHSIAAVYDRAGEATLEGSVVRFEFVNPHPFVTIEAEESGGAVQSWRLEMDNRRELAEVGFEAETLRPGDRIVVVGNPSRRDSNALHIRRLDHRGSGFNYQHHP